MGFPQELSKASPADTDNPSAGAAQIRNLKLFLEDLLGIQDATAYSAAAFSIGTAGQVTVAQPRMLLQSANATTPSVAFSGATGTGFAYDSSAAAIAVLKNGSKVGYLGLGGDLTGANGQVTYRSGVPYVASAYYDVTSFGASTAGTAAANTTAFNAAIVAAAAAKVALSIPVGDWNLNALAEITSPIEIFGSGRGTKLIFNTTADAIHLHPATSLQADTFYLHDLAFDNLTNTPASFLRNQNGINVKGERLYFSDCAATYCVDNECGHGLRLADCVFSDVTGSAIRLQDDGAVTKYSYAAILDGCDITRMIGGDGIDIDGTEGLTILGGVIESCTGYGIRTNYRASAQIATVQSWGINIHGTYFEGNGTDIGCETAADYTSRITMVAPTFNGVSAISLGAYGRLVVVGGQISGGSTCTISGSSDARVTLVGHVEHNFTQSGTFQWNDLGQYYEAESTPTWISTGTQPDLGDGTLTSYWSRSGNLATLRLSLTMGSTTTFGDGTYLFRDALLTLVPCTHPSEAVGSVMLYDATGAYRVGVAYMDDAIYDDHSVVVAFDATDANGYLTSLSPWTWAANDFIRLEITYRC